MNDEFYTNIKTNLQNMDTETRTILIQTAKDTLKSGINLSDEQIGILKAITESE